MKKSQVKELILKLGVYYAVDLSDLNDYNFYINDNNGKVYLSSVDLDLLELEKIMGKGIYFGTYHDEDRFRLSVEGSKFVNPKENYVEISSDILNDYLSSKDLDVFVVEKLVKGEDNYAPFLLVICEGEMLGSVTLKGDKLLNYMPKSRRVQEGKLY